MGCGGSTFTLVPLTCCYTGQNTTLPKLSLIGTGALGRLDIYDPRGLEAGMLPWRLVVSMLGARSRMFVGVVGCVSILHLTDLNYQFFIS